MPAITAATSTLQRLPAERPEERDRPVRSITNAPAGFEGEGFPVRRGFAGVALADLDPFVHFDQMGEVEYALMEPKGTPWHPHRGFETVTIVYDGEVEHRDSTGEGGIIGPGDVQWMTAGGGILHEEFHSPTFGKTGGPFRMVQLWVNLPAKDKMTAPGYQGILNAEIPTVTLSDNAGTARIIAGELDGAKGPARTFTPINVWDVRLNRDAETTLAIPDGHTGIVVVLNGHVTVNGDQPAGAAEALLLDVDGAGVTLKADADSTILMLSGEPIAEPIVGYGPFVMNTEDEIRQAINDFNSGRFGQIAAA